MKAKNVEDFEDALVAQTPVLFAAIKKHSGGGGTPTLGAGANVSANNAAPQAVDFDLPGAGASKMALMGFESAPPGAMVMVDGTARCETPCSKKLVQGRHQIAMTKLGYVQHAEAVAVSSSQTLRWTLVRDAGTLKLTSTSNHTLRVEGPDGPVEAPATTPVTLEVAPGVYTVSVGDSKCFVPHTQTLVVKRGETTPATFTPAVLPAGLKVEFVDGKGSDLEADVYADGVKVGDTMAPFRLPVCSTNVEVRYALHAPVRVVKQLVVKTLTTVKLTTGGVTFSDENIRLQKGCDGGYMDDCYKLGYNYDEGIGVPKDLVKANALYKRACDVAGIGGCAGLGWNYANGLGVPKDVRKASALYKRACDGGNMAGCSNLGHSYNYGLGVPKDVGKGFALYKRACDGGDMGGCFKLGYSYNYGVGGLKHLRKGNVLYKRACDGGNMEGCGHLGYNYLNGIGVSRTRSKGRRLLQRACDGGHEWSCLKL